MELPGRRQRERVPIGAATPVPAVDGPPRIPDQGGEVDVEVVAIAPALATDNKSGRATDAPGTVRSGPTKIARGTQNRDSWNEAFADWRSTPENALLRSYSDLVNRRLIARWLPDLDTARVLKTDLFDEAVGEGLYLELRTAGATVAGVDVSTAVVTKVESGLRGASGRGGRRTSAPVRRRVVRRGHLELDARPLRVVRRCQRLRFRSSTESCAQAEHFWSLSTTRRTHSSQCATRSRLACCDGSGSSTIPSGVTCGPGRLADALVRAAGFAPERAGAVMHFPRVVARAVAVVVGNRRAVLAFLIAFERLDRWPLRYLSGQFVAVRAVKLS